jgi:hypothetical protein
VGREILTLGEGFNTQVITLRCFYIVAVASAEPRIGIRTTFELTL